MSKLVTRENFHSLMKSLNESDNKNIISDETIIGLYPYITKSNKDRLQFRELINKPLYLYRPEDPYCYILTHNEIETDFLAACWHDVRLADQLLITSVVPDKVKIGIQTDPLARFVNNFKLFSLETFKKNISQHPVGFTMIGEKNISEAISSVNTFKPFIPQEELHKDADLIISYDVFYNTDLIESCSLETLVHMKKFRKKYKQLYHNSLKLEAHSFYYAMSRNLFIEESVYWTIMSSQQLKQLFDNRYNTQLDILPLTYENFMRYYVKEDNSN